VVARRTIFCKIKQNRQCAYKRNIEAPSRCNCYIGKGTVITYSECVPVTLSVQHAMRMHRVFVCGLSGSTIFFHIISNGKIFGGGGELNTKCVF